MFIIIWSVIGYQIFIRLTHKEDITTFKQATKPIILQNDSSFSFALSLNYPDPFLKEMYRYTKKKEKKFKTVSVHKESLVLPEMAYIGFILSKQDKKIAIVKIENRERMMNIGDSIGRFKLHHIYNDSLTFSSKTQFVNIKINK